MAWERFLPYWWFVWSGRIPPHWDQWYEISWTSFWTTLDLPVIRDFMAPMWLLSDGFKYGPLTSAYYLENTMTYSYSTKICCHGNLWKQSTAFVAFYSPKSGNSANVSKPSLCHREETYNNILATCTLLGVDYVRWMGPCLAQHKISITYVTSVSRNGGIRNFFYASHKHVSTHRCTANNLSDVPNNKS